MAGLEEWSSRRRRRKAATADRIRLTGSLRHFRRWYSPRRIPSMRTTTALVRPAAMVAAPASLVTAGTARSRSRRRQRCQAARRGRPGEGASPSFPRRRASASTSRARRCVVPQHPVPQAKFPVIDIHSHQPTPITAGAVRHGRRRAWTPMNLRVMVNASGAPATGCVQALAAHQDQPLHRPHGACSPTSTSATSARAGHEGRGAARGRRARPARSALGEIIEGLRPADPEGRRHAAEARRPRARSGLGRPRRLNIPVFIHTADPPEFFQPLDFQNERWLELALYPDRRYPAGEFPRSKS